MEFLRYLLPGLAGGLGVYFLIRRAQNKPNTNLCRYGIEVIGIAGVGAVLFLILLLNFLFNNPTNDGLNEERWLVPAYIFASISFIIFFLDTIFRVFHWSDSELTVKRLGRKTLHIKWEEISSLRYNPIAQWYVLKFHSGEKAVFYDMMQGSKYLISACDTHSKSVEINI